MYSQIIGTQQIVVTAVFLSVMLVVLIVLRRKGGAIRASLKAGKRIAVIEDAAVSPTERLRLISVDDSEFLMLSAKGQAPVLMPFTTAKAVPANTVPAKAGTSPSMGLADIDAPKQASSAPSALQTGGDTLYPSPAERATFIEKFQSWRRDHAAG
ncbi:MAG: flagellar biosynthetic protein FliO [Proteobacteria bacterium]|nr:flagellar biosynthetic protein FliO [Pseudomonadota bacterium]MDA0845877.1 flagellar biosynthetic protein FliO [Pseudomonadota bacterium]